MRLAGAAALTLVLAIPATASADGLDELQRLAKRNLEPSPLVFTTGPPIMRPLLSAVRAGSARSRQGYALRLAHYTPYGPDAIIALRRGDYRSVGAARRWFTQGKTYRATPAKVRGKRGYLLTRRRHLRERYLVWAEDGQVYMLGSGTPRKISLKDLRAAAAGLDHLERDYVGSLYDQDTGNSFGAVLVTTTHTVTGFVEFSGTCTMPNGSPASAHAGQASFYALPRRGNDFSVPFTADTVTPAGWSGTITGSVAPNAMTVNARATGTFDGEACDTGPLTVTADQRARY